MKELTKAFHYLVSTENSNVWRSYVEFLQETQKVGCCVCKSHRQRGRKAINIALQEQRKEIHRYLHVCGRYRLDERALVHRSETCEVLFAVDLEDKSEAYRDGRPVALKMMKHRHQWESEIRARQNHSLSSSCVVDLLAWHVAEGEETIPVSTKLGTNLHLVTAYKYILVMDRGDSSVFQAMITQRLAGYNESVVAHVCREIARSVSELHKANLVHYDLKLRNILVSNEVGNGCEVNEESRVMLCDLDASSIHLE